jgi:hypothetical protein
MLTRATGDERLNDGKKRVPKDTAQGEERKTAPAAKLKKTGQRTADVGRALRSVYDETLREDVPDEFKDLLGKLS